MFKYFFTIVAFLLFTATANAQTIYKVNLSGTGSLEKIAFLLNEAVVVNISKDGSLLTWGVDNYVGRADNYNDRLVEYTGKTGYYGENDNEAFRGKLRFIGQTYFTYYGSYDNEMLRGKIKSIGNMPLDYYLSYDNETYRGNIKSIGSMAVTWYGSFDNVGYKGKLKNLGITAFSYYSSFDDKLIRGKIKMIDRTAFTYYTSQDQKDYRGGFKTGSPLTYVNGIKFFIGN